MESLKSGADTLFILASDRRPCDRGARRWVIRRSFHVFTFTQNRLKIDDVLGVWPLHGVCGAWGGIAAGIFGATALGGLGGVAFGAQVAGTLLGVVIALLGGVIVYGALKMTVGLRLDAEEEFNGAALTIHKVSSTPDQEVRW